MRLKGLRRAEWTWKEANIPREKLDEVSEWAASRRIVGFASSSDLQVDETVMRHAIPNNLSVWYLDQAPGIRDQIPVQYEVGSAPTIGQAGEDIAAWMCRAGLRRGDLLGITVHPERAAGARRQTL